MDKRPVNLDLSTIKLPITALASITHRVTGVILLGAVLIFLWMLDLSLSSAEGFAEIQSLLGTIWAKLIVWAMLSALAYHLVSGLRHLLMDLGLWENLEGGKASAKISIAIAIVIIVLAGVWTW